MQYLIRHLWKIFMIALLAAGGYLFWTKEAPAEELAQEEEHEHDEFIALSPEQIHDSNIEISTAGPGIIQRTAQLPGKVIINTDKLAHIVPKVSGIVLKTTKNVGEMVNQGELLAVLESKEMAEAKSAYLAALKKQQLASSVLDREQNLFDKKISASQDYHSAKSDEEQSSIDLELARQHLQTLGMTAQEIDDLSESSAPHLRVYEMPAPIKGTVLEKNITNGEMIGTDRETYIIADLSNLWGEIIIYPHDVSSINTGQVAELRASDGTMTKARIIYLNPVIDEDTRTAKAIASINNSTGKWRPGTFFSATIILDAQKVNVAIPKNALHNIEGKNVVFVAKENGFEIRPVTMGINDSKNVEITSGLEPGEKYASTHTFLLKADHGKDEAEHMD